MNGYRYAMKISFRACPTLVGAAVSFQSRYCCGRCSCPCSCCCNHGRSYGGCSHRLLLILITLLLLLLMLVLLLLLFSLLLLLLLLIRFLLILLLFSSFLISIVKYTCDNRYMVCMVFYSISCTQNNENTGAVEDSCIILKSWPRVRFKFQG